MKWQQCTPSYFTIFHLPLHIEVQVEHEALVADMGGRHRETSSAMGGSANGKKQLGHHRAYVSLRVVWGAGKGFSVWHFGVGVWGRVVTEPCFPRSTRCVRAVHRPGWVVLRPGWLSYIHHAQLGG